jgi:hypothetical protein
LKTPDLIDDKVTVLVAKVQEAFDGFCDEAWLEWGSAIMLNMKTCLENEWAEAEAVCLWEEKQRVAQEEFERWVLELAGRMADREERAEKCAAREAELLLAMEREGADMDTIEGEVTQLGVEAANDAEEGAIDEEQWKELVGAVEANGMAEHNDTPPQATAEEKGKGKAVEEGPEDNGEYKVDQLVDDSVGDGVEGDGVVVVARMPTIKVKCGVGQAKRGPRWYSRRRRGWYVSLLRLYLRSDVVYQCDWCRVAKIFDCGFAKARGSKCWRCEGQKKACHWTSQSVDELKAGEKWGRSKRKAPNVEESEDKPASKRPQTKTVGIVAVEPKRRPSPRKGRGEGPSTRRAQRLSRKMRTMKTSRSGWRLIERKVGRGMSGTRRLRGISGCTSSAATSLPSKCAPTRWRTTSTTPTRTF